MKKLYEQNIKFLKLLTAVSFVFILTAAISLIPAGQKAQTIRYLPSKISLIPNEKTDSAKTEFLKATKKADVLTDALIAKSKKSENQKDRLEKENKKLKLQVRELTALLKDTTADYMAYDNTELMPLKLKDSVAVYYFPIHDTVYKEKPNFFQRLFKHNKN